MNFKYLIFLYIVMGLFIISCELENDISPSSVKCSNVRDCRADQNCEITSAQSNEGFCVSRKECETDSDCDNDLLCIDEYSKKHCGTRQLFAIKDSVLSDAIVGKEYFMNESLKVENNSSKFFYFEIVDSSKLPQGLELSEAGILSGSINSEAKDYSFEVRAINGKKDASLYLNYKYATKTFTIKVTETINDCDNNCPTNSLCNQETNECDCNAGYTGDNCGNCDEGYHQAENDNCVLDEICEQNSCTQENKTICNVVSGMIECSCVDGYIGNNCIYCDEGYHKVDDTCVVDEVCDENSCTEENKTVCNTVDGLIQCSCDELSHDEGGICVLNPVCDESSCTQENKTVCNVESELIVCSCDEGYHDFEDNCVIDEVCDEQACTQENKTTCNVISGLVQCSCDENYHDFEGTCVIDEVCDENSCTQENKTVCNVVEGLVECSCDENFHDENDVCVANSDISWCNTQWPHDTSVNNTGIYGRVRVDGITNSDDESSLIIAQLCYFLSTETIYDSTCVLANFNKNVQNSDDDEYFATLDIPRNGVYNYYYQFKIDGDSEYKKCDLTSGTDYQNSETYQELTGLATITEYQDGNLFISEYIEGRGDDKYIELYAINGDVNLDGWSIKIATNALSEFSESNKIDINSFQLLEGQTYVLSHEDAEGYIANQGTALLIFNGNDTVGLFNPAGELVDIVGVLGDDQDFAKNTRLIRKPMVHLGVSLYDEIEWESGEVTATENLQDNLGTHSIE